MTEDQNTRAPVVSSQAGHTHKPGECAPLSGLLCRRYYPGYSACQQFGGNQKCLLDLREAALSDASPAPGGMGDLADELDREEKYLLGHFDAECGIMPGDVQGSFHRLRTAAAQSAEVRERTIELPLAVRLRNEEGPPLPQMIAQRRAQLSIERTREHTEFQNADALADEYESGLRKMEASSYEEFADVIPKHKLIIKALRAFCSLAQAGGKL